MKKYDINALCELEKTYGLWDMKFLDYPIWASCREQMSSQTIVINSTQNIPSFSDLIKSSYQTIKFLFTQKKYKNLYFMHNRVEILESFKNDSSENKILFLHHEQDKSNKKLEYISSDFFNVIRFILRKTVYIFAPFYYYRFITVLKSIHYDKEQFYHIKNAMGDALFLKLLSSILGKHISVYYAGAVVPYGEKFLNYLNSYEIQHGVIHAQHVGYIGIPTVQNTLVVYHDKYKDLLESNQYEGKIEVNYFKNNFLNQVAKRSFFAVIYTQPSVNMQKSIEEFFISTHPKNIMIQRHPKDTYKYNIDSKYFVENTLPNEVEYPICYTSTVIENFLLLQKRCLIFDVKENNIDINHFLAIYESETTSKLERFDSLEAIYSYLESKQDIKSNS